MRPLALAVCLLCVSLARAEEPFPTADLLPKRETGVLRFLERHPEFDGRGVVVAIFDTGVDPGAPGLRTTTDGEPKIVDVVDGTGAGDVDTTTMAKPADGKLEGLTGRVLTVDPDWTNPSGRYRIGMKRAYDFFPEPLVGRLKRDRRRAFDRAQQSIEVNLRNELATWKREHPKPSSAQKLRQAELEKRLEQLAAVGKAYDDPGPLFDCVLFEDGERWRAVVDTDEDGDLADEHVLTDFRAQREFGTFPFDSLLNFAVNVYDDGDTLSIVVDSGTHGTHVAGIVAAHYPDDPGRNGVAPGAQIVSVKIGDTRLGTMETEAGFSRGLKAVLRNGCDAINLSYGEPTSTPNRGRIVELFSEVVDEHGVVFVASAGNAGPALSTVGAPGGTTSAILGVGAYVPPTLARTAYAQPGETPDTAYTWTSRGPTTDGDLGVDIFAPGGAVAPVPGWSVQPHERMNGTSMASPNACGAVALLLSAAKQSNIATTPYSIRRALRNTARPIEALDIFAQGPGLMQIDRAWEHLAANAETRGERLRYDVAVDGGRGIHLREPHETARVYSTTVRVTPHFPKKSTAAQRVKFEQSFRLRTDADWIDIGEFVVLHAGGREFDVRVATRDLEPGVHFAWIEGVDPTNEQRGPVFRVPVTVVKPEAGHDGGRIAPRVESFAPSRVVRRFLAVPDGATSVDVTLRVPDEVDTPPRRFLVHTVQLVDGETFESHEKRQYVTLSAGETWVDAIAVEPGRTLELCIAQEWSSDGEGPVEIGGRFRGLRPDDTEVVLEGGERTATVDVVSALHAERLDPRASLTTVRRVLAPVRTERRVLRPERDELPDGSTMQELRLIYEWKQPERGRVTLRLPDSDGLLYDSPTGGATIAVYDEHDRRVGFDDAYPDAFDLAKGPHEIHVRLRHDDATVLDAAEKRLLQVDRPLKNSVALRIAGSRAAAVGSKGALRARDVPAGGRASVTIVAPNSPPSGVVAGDVLLGTITYGRNNTEQEGSGARPGGYPLRWVPSLPVSAASTKSTSSESASNDLVEPKLRKTYAKLLQLDTTEKRKEHLVEIAELCDRLLESIDRNAVARQLGRRAVPGDAKSIAARKRAERLRDHLADLLYRKGRALGYRELPDVVARHPIEDQAALDRDFGANFRELSEWVDTTDAKYVLLHVRWERRRERFGHALEQLAKRIAEDGPTYWTIKKRRDVYEQLGWTHAFEHEQRWLMIRFPKVRDPL